MIKEKLKAVIIDDKKDWLDDLCHLLEKQFDCQLEPFNSFDRAEKRLLEKEMDFDLLITDIFPRDDSKSRKGVELARLVIAQDIPVIVVTGVSEVVLSIFREEEVEDVFDKGRFEGANFITSIKEILKKRREGGNRPSTIDSSGRII